MLQSELKRMSESQRIELFYEIGAGMGHEGDAKLLEEFKVDKKKLTRQEMKTKYGQMTQEQIDEALNELNA